MAEPRAVDGTRTVDVAAIIDAQTLRALNYKILAWSFLLVFVDGYDFSAPGFSGPALIKAWNIVDMKVLGSIFSASIFGILFGAPLLGYVADRFGRRAAIMAGALVFGAFSLAATRATGVGSFIALRFLAGVGLGGVMPITIALNAEYAPRRLRAKLVCIMFSGLSAGVGVPGVVAKWLIPVYGWQVMFLIGGLVPIALAVCLYFALPESPKYLALRPERRADLARILRAMSPGLAIPADARFVIGGEAQKARPSVADLFAGRYALVTPVLWLLFIVVGMVQYSIQTWTPTLLATAGFSVGDAALATLVYQLGAATGGLVMGWPVDRFGWRPLTLCLLLAIPVVAAIGLPGLPRTAVVALMLLAGFLVIGTQFGMNAIAGIMYPSFVRANGVGWALGIARLGFIGGAMAMGWLAAMKLPLQDLFFFAAAPLVIAVAASFTLGRLGRGSALDAPEAAAALAPVLPDPSYR